MADLDRLPNIAQTPDVESFIAGENNDKILDYHLKNAELKRFLADTRLRTHLVYIFSGIIFLWLAAAVTILCLNKNYFDLSDNVLITLLTTTSINVIGMMLIILRNLFPQAKLG